MKKHKFLINNKSKPNKEEIVLILLKKQIEKSSFLALLLIAIGGIYSIILLVFNFSILNIKFGIIVVIILLLVALLYRIKLLKYRIAKGYYGNNYYEAKEIIKFIDEEKDEEDSSGGGFGDRSVFPKTIGSAEEAIEVWGEGMEGQKNNG